MPPFKHIALSLSGGGTRAIGFHIGTLDYLARTDLLGQVKILSTVSGGSLIGTSYALSLEEDISFSDLFYDLFEFLPKANIVEGLMDVLTRKDKPVAAGQRDLATGLAEIYHEQFFSHYFSEPTFGAIKTGKGDGKHLEEVAFSATDFRTGVAFRFQKSLVDCRIGNGNVWLEPDSANELRIADIVTASSCIPAGFEPLSMPADFHWPDYYRWGDRKGEKFGPVLLQSKPDNPISGGVALMDGGVYDNQGLTTVLLAISRRMDTANGEQPPLENGDSGRPRNWARWSQELFQRFTVVDLFIISDTPPGKTSFYNEGDNQHKDGKFSQWLRKRTLANFNTVFLFIALLLILSSLFTLARFLGLGEVTHVGQLLGHGLPGYLHFFGEILSLLVPVSVAGMIGMAMLTIRSRIEQTAKKMESSMPPLPHSAWHYLRKFRIGDLMGMLKVRTGSVLAMVTDIFAHRIRQLSYNLAYANSNVADTLLANEIYTLDETREKHVALPEKCEKPAPVTRAICEMSAGMHTKSWFDPISAERLKKETAVVLDPQQVNVIVKRPDGSIRTDLDVLAACGQLTTCFNLISWLDERKSAEQGPARDSLLGKARQDWNLLQANPFRFIDDRLSQGRSDSHREQIARNTGTNR